MLETSVNQVIQEEFGITWEEYSVLAILGRSPRRFWHMTELAEALGNSRSWTTRAVARQQSRGRLIRSECPKGARATHASLTEQGVILVQRADSVYEAVVRDSLDASGIGAEQLVVLAEVLKSLTYGLGRPVVRTGCTRRRLMRPDRAEATQATLGVD